MARTAAYTPRDKTYRRERYERNRALIDAHKTAAGCKLCPTSVEWPAVALDLHHRDPAAKDPQFHRMAERWGVARIVAELAKCDVLCACHHRIVDHGARLVHAQG